MPNGRRRRADSQPGIVTLEITTLNKTDFCINNLRILAENPEALEHVKEIMIVDQGTAESRRR